MTLSSWADLATVVTAGVAVLAALFAGWQVWEIRRTRDDQARPFVVVDIQSSAAGSNFLNLVVENIGTTLATDVRIRFEPELESSRANLDLADTALLRDGIPALPPRRRITAFFDVSHERCKTDLPMRYEVTVQYRDGRGRKQEPLRYIVDFAHLYGLTQITEYGLHDAAKALREMQKSMSKWTGSRGRLNVWIRDEDEHVLSEHIEKALTGEYPHVGKKSPPDWLMAVSRNVFLRTLLRHVLRLVRQLRPVLVERFGRGQAGPSGDLR